MTQQQQQQQTNVLSLSPRKRVLFVDATWYHKGQQPHQGRLDFEKGPRIPGSVYFDLSDICESNPDWLSYIANKNMTTKTATTTTNNNKDGQEEEESVQLSWMLPSRQLLDLVLDALVEGNDDNNNDKDDSMVEQKKKTKDWEQTHIIVYGQTFPGCSFIPRVWFTFWRLGLFARVSILNGTLEDDWTGPMELTSITVPWMKDILLPSSMDDKNTQNNKDTKRQEAQDDKPPLQDKSIVVVKRDQVLQDANGDPTILLDARGSSFAKKGHIPGAIQIPYSTLMDHNNHNRNNNNRNKKDIVADSNNLLFKDQEAMQTLFQQAGVDPTTKQTVVCSVYRLVVFMSRYWNADVITRIHFCMMGVGRNGPKLKHCPKFFPLRRRRRPPLLPNIRTNSSCCSNQKKCRVCSILSWVKTKTKETLVVWGKCSDVHYVYIYTMELEEKLHKPNFFNFAEIDI